MFAQDSDPVKASFERRIAEFDAIIEAARTAGDELTWFSAYAAKLELRAAADLQGTEAAADDPARVPDGCGPAEPNDMVDLYCEWFDRGLRCEAIAHVPDMSSIRLELALAAYEAGWMAGCDLIPDREYDDGFIRAVEAEEVEIGSILGRPAWDPTPDGCTA